MERIKPKIKFIGLHCHDGFSLFDGLGLPQEHMDFVYSNGMDAFAVTDSKTQILIIDWTGKNEV